MRQVTISFDLAYGSDDALPQEILSQMYGGLIQTLIELSHQHATQFSLGPLVVMKCPLVTIEPPNPYSPGGLSVNGLFVA